MNIFDDDITRLNFEDILFIILIIGICFNIYADNCEKKYIINHDKRLEVRANKIYIIVLIVTGIIYLYYLYRNYDAYKKSNKEDKNRFEIKLLGSAFFIAGILCLIYFQYKDPNFIGAPSI